MTGKLVCNHSGNETEYVVHRGWDLNLILQMSSAWSAEQTKIIQKMLEDHPEVRTDPNLLPPLVAQYNLEDWHWDWPKKAMVLNGPAYTWFYLLVEDVVQAVCITYHPKVSRVDEDNIFYVDYLASAQWNRNSPGYTRKFSGLASKLLSHCVSYSRDVLKFRLGFCLHSLPGAEGFYLKIGMRDFGLDASKEMKYFEASEDACTKLLESA